MMMLTSLALSLLAAPAPAPSGRLDFPKLKAELVELTGGASTVDDLLGTCQHTPLGAFDVYFPAYAAAEYGDLHAKALAGLVDCQREWLELMGEPGSPGVERGLELCAELGAWAKKRGRSDEPPTGTNELRALFMGAGALGYEPFGSETGGVRVVLAPDRRDFQRLVAFFGEANPRLRGLYWHEGTRVWTEFWWNDIQVLALEYPPPAGDSDDPGEGFRMDFREPTGLEQHVAQRGAMGLVWHTFGAGLPPSIEVGLAQQVVVEAYGENNVRSGGSMRGNETAAFEAFIPGGNPNGGILPPISADSDWRADKGEDHFVKALHLSQKAAGKGAPHPLPGEQGPSEEGQARQARVVPAAQRPGQPPGPRAVPRGAEPRQGTAAGRLLERLHGILPGLQDGLHALASDRGAGSEEGGRRELASALSQAGRGRGGLRGARGRGLRPAAHGRRRSRQGDAREPRVVLPGLALEAALKSGAGRVPRAPLPGRLCPGAFARAPVSD